MNRLLIVASSVIALAGSSVFAQNISAENGIVNSSPGKVEYYSKVRREATVTSIDEATRTVGLRLPDGGALELIAGPDVKNLDKVRVGDKVVANYEESVELSLLKGGEETVGRREEASNLEGASGNPGATASKKVTLTGNVTKVDKATGVISLQGATHSVDMTIRDPKQLDLIKVGDQVQAVSTQTLALSLEQLK